MYKRQVQQEEEKQKPETEQEPTQTAQTAYSMAQLADYDFLMKHFYNVHTSTTAGRDMLRANTMLETDLTIEPDSSSPQILIYHSHSQEAFADSGENQTVVEVGDYLTELLQEKGFGVIHDRSCLLYTSGELIGAFGSTKRAIFMMLCAFFADVCRRTYDPLTALGLAAVWITWNHPYQILQSGFQLSFGAVLGICLLKLPEAPENKGKKAEKKGLAGMGVNMAGSIKKGPVSYTHLKQKFTSLFSSSLRQHN